MNAKKISDSKKQKTTLIKISSNKKKVLSSAGLLIKAGELVAFPTETVYGLGANALDEKAVAKIFVAKSRPADNPLIVHISKPSEINLLVTEVPTNAKKLMKKFWPGPLTIVLKKSNIVPDIVTAGMPSVAIRMPSNKIALELIKSSGVPIAAPSANTSTKPSPTTAMHVFEDLNGRIPLIIDGGKCEVGLESTVVDLSGDKPIILRPGKITLEQIEKVIGKTSVHSIKTKLSLAPSPGMKYRHYSPKAKVILLTNQKKIGEFISNLKPNNKFGVLSFSKELCVKNEVFFDNNLEKMAQELFGKFREFDNLGISYILVEAVPEKGMGLALMNRLRKASSKII
jgi:L-threonylcarbamoyladenylate synthase